MDLRIRRRILCALLSCTVMNVCRATIVESPSDTEALVGHYANFTCAVSCTHFIEWHVEGFQYVIGWDMEGFNILYGNCHVQDGKEQINETLQILAGADMNGSAVQCASIPTMPNAAVCNQVSFSRFSVLTVLSPVTEEPPAPLCPSPSPVQEINQTNRTVTTVTVTEVLTVTATQSVTVTVHHTPTPTSPASDSPPQSSRSSIVWLDAGLSTRLIAGIVSILVTAILVL